MVGIIIDLVGCAAPPTSIEVIILVWTCTSQRPASFNFRSHLMLAASPIHAWPASLSTIKCPGRTCCVFFRLTSPGCCVPVRLLLHGVQERQS